MNELRTVRSLVDGLSEYGDRPALLALRKQQIEEWSYAKLADHVQRLAQGLAEAGEKLSRGQQQGATEQEQILSLSSVVGSALAVYGVALAPPRRLRQRLMDQLNEIALRESAAGRVRPICTQRTEDDRDAWIYEKVSTGVKYQKIIADLAKKPDWSPIESVQGIRDAARRYADRNGKPRPPSRQRK